MEEISALASKEMANKYAKNILPETHPHFVRTAGIISKILNSNSEMVTFQSILLKIRGGGLPHFVFLHFY
jgi:hypothetical protein